jgi:hypothetical protein
MRLFPVRVGLRIARALERCAASLDTIAKAQARLAMLPHPNSDPDTDDEPGVMHTDRALIQARREKADFNKLWGIHE